MTGSAPRTHELELAAGLYNSVSMNSRAKWRVGLVGTLLLGTLLFALEVKAEPVAQLKATDYVNDFAHVLDSVTIAQMDDICRQIDEKAHAQIAVVTVHSLDGSDIESYAVDLFHAWGVGNKSTTRGVLFLYPINDRRARVEVGYGLEPILPDGKVGGFQREAAPLIHSEQYNQALLLVTSRVAGVIAQDAAIQLTNAQGEVPVQQPRQQPSSGISLGGIVIIGIVILVILFTPLRSDRFWMIFSGMFGGGGRGGGWGGGGLGGGGGGGGFGGFGGGSSGGGGASSSW